MICPKYTFVLALFGGASATGIHTNVANVAVLTARRKYSLLLRVMLMFCAALGLDLQADSVELEVIVMGPGEALPPMPELVILGSRGRYCPTPAAYWIWI